MLKFTISEDSLPFGFLEEVDISWTSIAIDCIKTEFSNLSNSKCEVIFENNYDFL